MNCWDKVVSSSHLSNGSSSTENMRSLYWIRTLPNNHVSFIFDHYRIVWCVGDDSEKVLTDTCGWWEIYWLHENSTRLIKNRYKSCTKWCLLMPWHVWFNSFLVKCSWEDDVYNLCNIEARTGKWPVSLNLPGVIVFHVWTTPQMSVPYLYIQNPNLPITLAVDVSMWHCWAINRLSTAAKVWHGFFCLFCLFFFFLLLKILKMSLIRLPFSNLWMRSH